MSDYYYIPDELLTKILTYLPAKSLLRFSCVCKSWKSLITSSYFITDHLNQTKLSNNINNNHLIFVTYPKEQHYSTLHIDNHTFDQYEVLEFPFPRFCLTYYYRVFGSCNGLICLLKYYSSITVDVLLWNPSIRKSLTIPIPGFMYRAYRRHSFVFGFGHDSRTNDYKVVMLCFSHSEEVESPRVELFKLSTWNWEAITYTIDPSYVVSLCHQDHVFVNGALHWTARHRDSGRDLIISFDMSDEVFHEINLPASFVKDSLHEEFCVAVYREWLSFIGFSIESNEYYSVWVMKDYGVGDSWTKLYTIDLQGELGKILGFRRNGDMLLARGKRELASYDPETRQIKCVAVCDSDKHSLGRYMVNHSFHKEAYVESLVLLGMKTDLERVWDDESGEEKEEHACDESEE